MATTSRRGPGRPELTARNDAWTDREILAIIDELASASSDGCVTTTEVGMQMGFSTNGNKNKTPATKVAGRLAWMRDGGLLKDLPPDLSVPSKEPGARDRRWKITKEGQIVLRGKVSNSVKVALEKMDTGAKAVLVKEVMRSGWIEGDHTTAFVLDRQIKHDRAQRKILFRQARAK